MGMMGLISAVILAILAIVGAAMSRQLTDEFKAWMPWIIRRIIERAVRQLPGEQRERFAEEWRSFVNDVPGEVGKLVAALGLLKASRRMSRTLGYNPSFAISKRILDLVLSLFGLILFGPVLAMVAVCIKADSEGPLLVRHARRGYKNKTIYVFTFRTQRLRLDGTYIGVTRAGRMLRRLNLDQLPQLFNVIAGDMSLVGPRPKEGSGPESHHRYDVKPGITGWAQINRHPRIEAPDDDLLDLYYVKNCSILLDLKILLMTLLTRRPHWPE